jgi:phosphatidyl-myo-inositol alpha-mannosyltransferase
LKIAQLCPYDISRPGGVQRHILDLSAALRGVGHDVSIVVPRIGTSTNKFKSPDEDACPIIHVGNGRLIGINKTQFEITWALGGQHRHLVHVLESGAFDLVHFHSLLSPFLPLQVFRRSQSANVATFHAVPPDGKSGAMQRRLSRAVSRRLLPRLDGVILASEVQKELHPTGEVSTPVAVLPPCTDLRRFAKDAPPIERYRDGRVNILFLGRLEARKGAMTLLQAYAELCRSGPPVRLMFAGGGPERTALERFVRDRGVANIIFLGRIEQADVASCYATCDIFCAPSLYAEGFGIVLAEAMACGKPIVAAANAGYRTVLHGEAANFLAASADAEALRAKLEALIADPALRQRLGAWGRIEAARYDSQALAPRFVSFYEQAIAAKSRRGRPESSKTNTPTSDHPLTKLR